MTSSVVRRVGDIARHCIRMGTLAYTLAGGGAALGQTAAPGGGAQETVSVRRDARDAAQSPDQDPAIGKIIGVVIDSLTGRPLVGAVISVEGVSAQTVTDSTGRFWMDSVPPGRYRLGIFHPLLDSMGLSIASPPLTVTAGATLALGFATPSAPTIVRLMCGAFDADTAVGAGPSLLIGRVLDAETEEPVPGVRVSLRSSRLQSTLATRVQGVRSAWDTTTGPNGEFRFCHLAPKLVGTVRAVRRSDDSIFAGRSYSMDSRLVGFLVMHIPHAGPVASKGTRDAASTSGSTSGVVPGGVLTGRVLRPDGEGPFAGAQVGVLGTAQIAVTGDSGEFTLRDLPTGTRTLEVRALGWEPVSIPVELTRREPHRIIVPLAVKTAVLEAVVVTATLNAGLHRVGFDTRKKLGIGHFMTPDEIARRNAWQLVDLMTEMPGVTRKISETGEEYLAAGRGPNGCVTYVIDGMAYTEATPGDINIVLRPEAIGAIEVYQASETPVQFAYTPPSMPPPPPHVLPGDLAKPTPVAVGSHPAGGDGTACTKILLWTKNRLGL